MVVKFSIMENKKIDKEKLNRFLDDENEEIQSEETKNEETSETKHIITNDKSIVERINKKVITEDGRQLLI